MSRISNVVGIRRSVLPFLEMSRAISVHVFVGRQWLAVAMPNLRSSSSVSWMDAVSCGYATRLSLTCFCWVVVFVVNVDVSYQ